MDGILNWMRQLQLGSLWETLLLVLASVLCITIHEACHGICAFWLGDDTAKIQGRLTLNPVRHIDPVGIAMMAIVRFGWAKPVPIDIRKFKDPKKGMALTALAGPVSNVLLAVIALIVRSFAQAGFYAKGISWLYYLIYFSELVSILSTGLAVFNLFPIPPLDGSKVLCIFLSDRLYIKFLRYERYGMVLLTVLLLTGLLDKPLIYMRQWLLQMLFSLTEPIFTVFVQILI